MYLLILLFKYNAWVLLPHLQPGTEICANMRVLHSGLHITHTTRSATLTMIVKLIGDLFRGLVFSCCSDKGGRPKICTSAKKMLSSLIDTDRKGPCRITLKWLHFWYNQILLKKQSANLNIMSQTSKTLLNKAVELRHSNHKTFSPIHPEKGEGVGEVGV